MAVTRKHIITRTYNNLKGFSTDSIYLRPPNVSDQAINMHREPDGSFAPRRGYQCEIANIGGLGCATFDNPCRCGIEIVCVHRDGNLYRRINQTITIRFNAVYAKSWFQFNIFTNPNLFNNTPGWSFSPWSLSPWSSPSGESITFNGFIKSAAIVSGNQTNVSTVNVLAGHAVQIGNMIAVEVQENQEIQSYTVTGITPTSITFIGGTITVKNNARIDIFVEQLFLKGYDVPNPYPISQFLGVLNNISGITAFASGDTTYAAAFIPIQEFTNVVSGEETVLNYYYWEKITAPINPLLPGSASRNNQNSPTFENASFCVFDEVLYCTNGYDFPVKYDGQNAYLAGMKKGDRPIVTDNGAGALPFNTEYYYAISYEQKDNATHIIEGQISDNFLYKTPNDAATHSNSVASLSIESNTGYNTAAALATGAADTVYGPDSNGFYYHFIATSPGHTFTVGDTAYYLDRVIAQVNWTTLPTAGVNLPIDPGYGVLVGDLVFFTDNTGVLRQRHVVDLDTTVTPNLMEIEGSNVDTSNNPAILEYVESPIYGHVGIADGNQLNVTTFNLKNGHNLQIGNVITFRDPSNIIQTRTITGRTATSITFAYSASILDLTFIQSNAIDNNQITLQTSKSASIVTNSNDPISNNLKVNIYRSQGSPNGELTELSLLVSLPNNPFSTNLTFIDNLLDSELAYQPAFGNPIQQPNPPPKCKYILTYQNLIIYAGGSRNPIDTEWSLDAFYWSIGDQPEAVPAATNFQLLPSNDDIISGLGISGSTLVVGKDRSIYSISGDLITSQFQVTPVAPGSNIGFAAHATVKSVGNMLYFLHTNGVYSMIENQMFPTDAFGDPIPLTKPIDVLFRTKPFDQNKQFVFKRAVAVNYTSDNEYWLFVPCENVSGTVRNANANSRVFCFDYMDKNWFQWDNINAAGGFVTIGDDIYWQERRLSGFVGNTANLYRQHRNYRLIDFADHTQPISVFWSSSWEDLDYPQVRKKFIRAMLLLARVDSLYQLNQPFLFFSSYLDRVPNLRDTFAPVTTVNNSTQWGQAWSWQKWSGLVDSFIRINLKNGTTAKSMQISLQMKQLNTSFKFAGFQLEISPEYDKTFVR